MKLLRLKLTDPKGFRSLQPGFEYRFRTEWNLQEEQGFSPFICAGRNGSGKSNLLEALTAVFYHMECIYLENLPDSFLYDEQENPTGFRSERAIPDGFEIEYLIRVQDFLKVKDTNGRAHIEIIKQPGDSPKWFLLNPLNSEEKTEISVDKTNVRQLLPEYMLGYSSGENEILSLPFFKMRFVQFDEYLRALRQQLPYPGRPESHMVFLDSGFSQAILLCNRLFQEANALEPFFKDVSIEALDVGIEALKEFRIIIRRSIEINEDQIWAFGSQDENKREAIEEIVKSHPALTAVDNDSGTKGYRVNMVKLLDGDDRSDKIIARLKRCATCWFEDETTDTLYLDYYINEATLKAFKKSFDFEVKQSPISLFEAFQVLLTLNLYSVSDQLKADLYQSNSLYIRETVPTLASDERILRFKNFWIKKKDIKEPILLKSLSDGEHQLLHALGLCLLFKDTNSLFLLDEPETHFNPDWRANFVTCLHQCFDGADNGDEMLVTTHTPFLISDSTPEKVLVFQNEDGAVSVSNPNYNTLGASINKITMTTFDKRETIGLRAQKILEDFKARSKDDKENKEQLIAEINRQLGDSVEKVLLIKTILDSIEAAN
jgi:restriction system-associated AAA family ATPase